MEIIHAVMSLTLLQQGSEVLNEGKISSPPPSCKRHNENNIHPSIFYTRLIQFREGVGLKPSPAAVGWEVVYTEVGPTQRRTKQTHENHRLESHAWAPSCMHAQGEHANFTQFGRSQDSNQEPCCCEATLLTTTPPCSQGNVGFWGLDVGFP